MTPQLSPSPGARPGQADFASEFLVAFEIEIGLRRGAQGNNEPKLRAEAGATSTPILRKAKFARAFNRAGSTARRACCQYWRGW